MLCLVGAVALGSVAVIYQRQESRPRGEGELFLAEGRTAVAMVDEGTRSVDAAETAVRRIRNHLRIEAVGLVDDDGTYVASTSPSWVGSRLEPPLLHEAVSDGRFRAITVPISRPVVIDGIEEWAAGESLYQVVQPREEGGAVVLSYDVSSLLERRASLQGVRSLTIVLAGGGVILLVAGILLLVGRAGARRRVEQAARETELMHAHNRELELRNVALDEARQQAERALELAEETNRIRSEFVLMINHELRTPLTSVVTGTELLLEPAMEEAYREEVLADIARDARRLQEMISQMLTVARVENRGLGYTLRDVPLEGVIERIDAMSADTVTWVDEGAAELAEVVVRTDPDPLSHLVLSLADNALTHGASQVRLAVVDRLPFGPMLQVGDVPADAVFVLVTDDGPGIDSDFLPRAFEKFEKLGRSSGTGLGLYLARLMVEAIEGALAVTTGPGGTTVAVAVPATRAQVREVVPG